MGSSGFHRAVTANRPWVIEWTYWAQAQGPRGPGAQGVDGWVGSLGPKIRGREKDKGIRDVK